MYATTNLMYILKGGTKMSIKTQKIIQFIPIINFIIFVFWFKMIISISWKISYVLKPLFSVFAIVIVTSIFRISLDRLCDSAVLRTVFALLSFYLCTMAMSIILVKEQEAHLRNTRR